MTLQEARDNFYSRGHTYQTETYVRALEDEYDELRGLLTDIVANVYRFEGSQWVEIPLSVIEHLRSYLSLWEEKQK